MHKHSIHPQTTPHTKTTPLKGKITDPITLVSLGVFVSGFFLLPLWGLCPRLIYLFLGLCAIIATSVVLYPLSPLLRGAVQVFIFFALFLGSCASFYMRFPHYDLMIHFISGVLVALCSWDFWQRKAVLFFSFPSQQHTPGASPPHQNSPKTLSQEKSTPQEAFLQEQKESFSSPPFSPAKACPVFNAETLFPFCFCLLCAFSAAGLWEVWEFLGDTFFGFNGQVGSLYDTMTDIIAGSLGGIFSAVFLISRAIEH